MDVHLSVYHPIYNDLVAFFVESVIMCTVYLLP